MPYSLASLSHGADDSWWPFAGKCQWIVPWQQRRYRELQREDLHERTVEPPYSAASLEGAALMKEMTRNTSKAKPRNTKLGGGLSKCAILPPGGQPCPST